MDSRWDFRVWTYPETGWGYGRLWGESLGHV